MASQLSVKCRALLAIVGLSVTAVLIPISSGHRPFELTL
jgi:hypothetical protein